MKLQSSDAMFCKKSGKNSKDFTPYIFTKDEIESILYFADRIGPNRNKFINTPFIYPAVIRLLYGCGLRVGEALTLLCNDVDLHNGVITIRNGKNNVSRLVPMSDSLNKYLFTMIVEFNAGPTLIFSCSSWRALF